MVALCIGSRWRAQLSILAGQTLLKGAADRLSFLEPMLFMRSS
jgi:hypothetical protein